jgi:hypothetical protein
MANYKTYDDLFEKAKLYCVICKKYIELKQYGTQYLETQECGDCVEKIRKTNPNY